MAEIRNSRRLKQLADVLVERCHDAGVTLFADQAAEILARKVEMTVMGMRISERYTLDRYFDEESVTTFARILVRQVEENRQVADQAPPLALSIDDAAHVCAAFGVAVKIARRHLGDTDAPALINKAADAVVLFSIEMSESSNGEITLAGQDIVYPRTVLTQVLDKLRGGVWSCICDADHETGPCEIQDRLIEDLGRLGSWISADAPPADARSPEQMLRAAQEQLIESLGLDLTDDDRRAKSDEPDQGGEPG
jgi:hypothetical protein